MSRTFLEYLNITSTANDNNSDNSNNNNKANNVNGNSDNNINNNDDDDNNDNTKIIISLILLIIYDIIKYSPMVIRFQAIWLVRWSAVISSYSSDWLYMENAWLWGCHVTFDSTEVIFESAASSDTNYYQINICRENNLLLYLIKLYLIKQLFYSTFWILADYNRFALRELGRSGGV